MKNSNPSLNALIEEAREKLSIEFDNGDERWRVIPPGVKIEDIESFITQAFHAGEANRSSRAVFDYLTDLLLRTEGYDAVDRKTLKKDREAARQGDNETESVCL